MSTFGPEEARRVARLARLALTPEEAQALALDMARITDAFGALASRADRLPFPEEPTPGALRADEAESAPPETVARMLGGVPRRDASTGHVRAPRGRSG